MEIKCLEEVMKCDEVKQWMTCLLGLVMDEGQKEGLVLGIKGTSIDGKYMMG